MGGSESHHAHQEDPQGSQAASDVLNKEREDVGDKEVAARAKQALSVTEFKCFNLVFAWLAGNSAQRTVERARLLVSLPHSPIMFNCEGLLSCLVNLNRSTLNSQAIWERDFWDSSAVVRLRMRLVCHEHSCLVWC